MLASLSFYLHLFSLFFFFLLPFQVEVGNATFTARVPEGAAPGDKFSVKLPGTPTYTHSKVSRK